MIPILYKIEWFNQRSEGYPVNSNLNDIFCARIIVNSETIQQVMDNLDEWKEKYGLKNRYLRDKEEYIGIHIYLKMRATFIALGNLNYGIREKRREIF